MVERESLFLAPADATACFPHPRGAQRASTESGGSAARAGAVCLRLLQGGRSKSAEQAGGWGLTRPILFAGGQGNLYVYVGNDPVGFVDPEGKAVPALAGAAVVGGLVGAAGSAVAYAAFSGNGFSPGGLLAAAGGGFIGGFTGTLAAAGAAAYGVGAVTSAILGSGLGGGLASASGAMLDGRPVDPLAVALAAFASAMGAHVLGNGLAIPLGLPTGTYQLLTPTTAIGGFNAGLVGSLFEESAMCGEGVVP